MMRGNQQPPTAMTTRKRDFLMANVEHQRILKKGAILWNTWIDSQGDLQSGPFRADLKGADLRGANLRDAKLKEADLSMADLSGAQLGHADLREADLRGADLSNANVFRADLSEADLRGAKLVMAQLKGTTFANANFEGADLGGTDLFRAFLMGANLKSANLQNANLSEARLLAADLSEASLGGADLSYASIGQTIFGNVELNAVKGLDDCDHHRPSTIGLNTLAKSKGLIPAAFLRGCGLGDWEIEMAQLYRENLTAHEETEITYRLLEKRNAQPIQYFSCFISYSHTDKEFARRLHDALQERGIRCWLDEKQLLPGDDIYEHIDQGIRLWDKVMLCCSELSLKSWWVEAEINKAFAKEQQLMKERGKKVLSLIPLDLDGYLFSGKWVNGKATEVLTRLAADFTEWRTGKFEQEVNNVILALRADAGARERPPVSRL
jgi:uncharacterized protein YjbI with pentapeptide repeats